MTRYVTDAAEGPALPLDSTTDEGRFRLFRLCECWVCGGSGSGATSKRGKSRCTACRGEGRLLEEVATAATPEAVGVALVTLAREGEWEDGCPFGLLDTEGEVGQKWLVTPWLPSARNLTDAARDLGRRSGQVRRERVK